MATHIYGVPLRPQCVSRSLPRAQCASSRSFSSSPSLNATLIRRPKRPYTFTQLVTLSDGSTFLHRTTSPLPVYKSNKDTRNTMMWNPSSQKLLNVEEDEAGRLRAFRQRFGRGWDSESTTENEQAGEGEEGDMADSHESLMDLISGYGKPPAAKEKTAAGSSKKAAGKSEKAQGGKK